VAIVDPVSRVAVAAGDEGEIWVRGPSVAAGYWGRAGATHETFAAERVGGGEGWLRTGDLGAIVDGELYPTGRLKTVLIHDGRKIAAEDLEAAAVAAGSVAAIAFEGAEGGIALAIELAPGASSDWAELGAAIRARIAEEPGAPIRTLHAVERGRLFRTASGKLERAASGRALEAGTLEALARWDAERGWSPR
jgi:acyl-CoA synthetase (AMP-forming)/AMP-acid ligase II